MNGYEPLPEGEALLEEGAAAEDALIGAADAGEEDGREGGAATGEEDGGATMGAAAGLVLGDAGYDGALLDSAAAAVLVGGDGGAAAKDGDSVQEVDCSGAPPVTY